MLFSNLMSFLSYFIDNNNQGNWIIGFCCLLCQLFSVDRECKQECNPILRMVGVAYAEICRYQIAH